MQAELKKMYCPSCGGSLSLDETKLESGQVITCPYCGNQFVYTDDTKRVKIDKTYTQHIIDDAAVKREETKSNTLETITVIVGLIIMLIVWLIEMLLL